MMPTSLEALLVLLDLEPLEVNLFRGLSPETPHQRVFGGQVAAQALVAAGRTVADDRRVHSLHSYFLRPGDPNSIDYGISALFEAFPERGFEASVRLYIAAEVTGRAVLASGTRKTMESLREAFARHRMSVEVTEAPFAT